MREVARALVVPEAAMAKRLTRARRKIAVAQIPYSAPSAAELPRRLLGVLTTVYLLFNEGYSATEGADHIRSLTGEAIRLGRMLLDVLPAEPGVTGLLALMLLQDSRRAARLDEHGRVVLLADQDRTRWDRAAIAEGMTLLGVALRRNPLRPEFYATQAAIAACHALADTWAATNWAAVLSWYDVLLTISETAVIRVNRAVAIAELYGPQAGLRALDEIGALSGYAPLPCARAELLQRLGRYTEAAAACREAIDLPGNTAQLEHLRRQLSRCERG